MAAPPRRAGLRRKASLSRARRSQHSSLSVEVPDHDFELSLIAEAEGALPSTPVRVRLKWAGRPPAQTIKPKMYALLIGVSHYEDKSVRALKWADKDAEDVKRILESQKGRLYRDVEARLIENEEATAARIVDELSWIESAASQGDRVIVFISGHGTLDERNSYFFVPYNARLERRGVLSVPARSTAVSHAQILDSLKRVQGHVLFFFDTCHAGGAAVGGAMRGDQTYQPFIDELRDASNGVLVLASSEGQELSQEDDDLKNGFFTRAVVEGLSGKADLNGDGVVTFDELSVYVDDRVKELTRNTQHPVREVVTPTRNLAVAAVNQIQAQFKKEPEQLAYADPEKGAAGQSVRSGSAVSQEQPVLSTSATAKPSHEPVQPWTERKREAALHKPGANRPDREAPQTPPAEVFTKRAPDVSPAEPTSPPAESPRGAAIEKPQAKQSYTTGSSASPAA